MDNRIQISDNFTLYHVQYNEMAVRLGIVNEITTDDQADNARALAVNILEPVWAELGPQAITSWYRGDALERDYSRNAYAKWCIKNRMPFHDYSWREYVAEKQHASCCCVTLRSHDNDALFKFLQKLPEFDTLQHKTHWISVSYSPNLQKRVVHE